MVKLTLSLSRPAKIAVVVAVVGAGLTIYGKKSESAWASILGTVMLFGGAITYYTARFKMFRSRRDES